MAFSVSYVYSISDKYSGALGKIRKATDKFTSGMGKAQATTKRFSSKLLGMQSTLGSVAAAIGGAAAMNKYVSFETQMNKLGAVALTTDENMAKMRDTAKFLGETTQFSATEAAAGMEQLKLAGLSVDKVLGAIPGTLQLAAAGSLSVASAADIATGVLGAMKLEIKDLPHVNDVLAAAQSKAKFTITELSESMRPVATTAKNLGVNLELLTASLGVMANANERGSQAGTLLRNAFTQIAGASVKQKKIYKALNINLSQFVDKAGQIRNFKGLIEQLSKVQKTGKLTVPVLQALFGERGFRAMQIIIGSGVEPLENLEKALKKSGGAAEKMAKIQMRGLPGIFKTLKSVTEALVIALFETGLDEFLISIGKKIITVVKSLKNANPIILKMAAALGTAVIVGGPLLIFFGMMAGAVSSIMGLFAGFGTVAAMIGTALTGPIGTALAATTLLYGTVKLLQNAWAPHKNAILDSIAGPLDTAIQKAVRFREEFTAGLESFIVDPVGFIKRHVGGGSGSVSANNASAMKGSLNGKIDITAKGANVKSELTSSLPGNLGFNIGGAL